MDSCRSLLDDSGVNLSHAYTTESACLKMFIVNDFKKDFLV